MPKRNSYETPKVLHDAPLRGTDQHHFHFDEFAATLARLIADKNTRTPLTIGVSGPWGSGKTTLLQRTRKLLDDAGDQTDANKVVFVSGEEKPWEKFRTCKTVWFDAWKYDDEDELLVALIRVILNAMADRSLGDKLWSKILDPQHPRYNVLATFLNMFKLKFGGVEVGVDLEKYKTDTPFGSHTAFFDFFDDAFEALLARWVQGTFDGDKIDENKGVLVIFIDDLDRCLPDKVVQVLEAIKLFMDKRGCVFVLGADTTVVREAVIRRYQAAGFTEQNAGDYLEKIVQMRFELPPIPNPQMQRYLDLEAKDVLDEEVRRNWSVLVIGAGNNPRKVKTFANDLNLRWAMLKNSGEAQGVNRDDFTRWQVLMRVAPTGFVKQLNNIDDPELRRKFVDDALKWVQGEASLEGTFREYTTAQELRRVLREIKAFSPQFDAKTLDAFVHLTAPPQPSLAPVAPEAKPQVPPEKAPEQVEFAAKEIHVTRGEVKVSAANVQVWGGVEFVRIPAGKFLMGSKEDNKLAFDDEKQQHTVEIPYEYWMARYPVTNEQFAKFVEEATYKFSLEENWKKKADHPVVNVSWYDAMEYCKWLNTLAKAGFSSQGLVARLPSEAEWEKAARGEYGNEWPWGNEFDPNKCNSSEGKKGGTTPVGAYSPQGDSPYGVADMVGNVWEWCHSLYQPYPYKVDDEPKDESASGPRVLRGGSFGDFQKYARCASRYGYNPDDRSGVIGFRVVFSPGF